MSILKAFRFYKSLTSEQKDIVAGKSISGVHTPEQWIKLLKRVAEFDEARDNAQKHFYILYFILIPATVILLFTYPEYSVIPVAMLLPVIYFNFSLQQRDLDNVFRLFIVPLIESLTAKMDPNMQLELKIGLGDRTSDSNLVKASFHVASLPS